MRVDSFEDAHQGREHPAATIAGAANHRESSDAGGSRPHCSVRIFLIEHYIAQQPRPRITPFQEIVAEDPVLGETSFERSLEGINFVYAFADERAFTKQVLVNIGNSTRIGIDAGLASAHCRIPRPVHAGQAHGDPWLKDAVTLADKLLIFVVPRTIQRVRHGAHKLPRRIARQLRIRVQGDHILHAR